MATPVLYDYPHAPIYGPAAAPRDLSGDSADHPYLGIYTQETTQRFILGTRFITWDGRVYKYSFADGTLDCEHGAEQTSPQHIAYNNVVAAQALGDYQVQMTVAATDGEAGNGNIAADELNGGYFLLFDNSAGNAGYTRGIVNNNAVTGGGTITIDIDMPWHFALTTSDDAEAMSSPYYNLTQANDSRSRTCACVPVVAAVDGEYFWGQTWGPCWISPQSNVGAGSSQDGIVFRHDGSIDNHQNFSQGDASYVDYGQYCGHVLSYGQAGGQGAPFVMLMISI